MTLSRRTYTEAKRYATVLFQENTHPGDFEMVELQDILNGERNALGAALISDGFLLDGFKAVGAALSNAVYVSFGTGYSEGRRIVVPDSLHQEVSGQYIFNFPNATPVVNRTDLLYVDVFVDTVDQAADPVIEDPLLGPSALRERVRYNFAISEGNATTNVPSLPVGHVGYPIASIVRRAADPLVQADDVTDVRPLASLNDQFKPQNVIVVSPYGGDFSDPAAAVASITASSESDPHVILVMPGVYTITSPLTFSQPYVAMVGVDPDACVIKGDFSGLSTARIAADNIVLRNLSLDFASGSGSHSAAVYFVGPYSAVLDNLTLGKAYYDENDTNAFSGLDMTAAAEVSVRRCRIYAQNSGVAGTVLVGSAATVTMADCVAIGGATDGLHHSNGGSLTLVDCSFTASMPVLVSSGNMTAHGCSWYFQNVKTFLTSGTPVTLTLGVTNKMRDCLIDCPGQGASSMTDTSADWDNVSMTGQFAVSGGGVSSFRTVTFGYGLDLNGAAATFISCQFPLAPGSWAIPGTSGEALVLRGSITPLFSGCLFTWAKNVVVLGGSPTFRGCTFSSSSALARVINVVSSSSAVVVDGCLIRLTASYALGSPIYIGGSPGTFTYTHNHLEGSSLGQPDYALRGTGASLSAGANTGTSGALRDPATITSATNIEQAP